MPSCAVQRLGSFWIFLSDHRRCISLQVAKTVPTLARVVYLYNFPCDLLNFSNYIWQRWIDVSPQKIPAVSNQSTQIWCLNLGISWQTYRPCTRNTCLNPQLQGEHSPFYGWLEDESNRCDWCIHILSLRIHKIIPLFQVAEKFFHDRMSWKGSSTWSLSRTGIHPTRMASKSRTVHHPRPEAAAGAITQKH